MENTEIEKIGMSYYCGYSETNGVVECPKCGKDIWCSIPEEEQKITCQSDECDWQGEFYDDFEE